jgi:hypothetical protein
MERKNGKYNNEALFKGPMMLGKLCADSVETMMDAYRKQMDFYNTTFGDYFNSMAGESKNAMNPAKTFMDLTFGNNPFKWMFYPANSFGSASFTNPFDKMFKQLSDFNQNAIGVFNQQFERGNADLEILIEEYQEKFNKQSEIIKEMLYSISNSYSKQTESYLKTTSDLQEELIKKINLLIKLNQEFWSDMSKSYQIQFDVEAFSEDGNSEKKKSSKVNVHS